MFVILTYDISQKRVGKILKICRKYLVSVQKSVFEGNLTQSKLMKLKKELEMAVNSEKDAVCIYILESTKYTRKEQIGVIRNHPHII